jgi:ABC-2 type transport system permease protein
VTGHSSGCRPIRPAEILAGKALSVFVYGLASLATVAVVTSVVFGADWGHPLVAALLCLAMALAVVALTALVISVARTERQADTLSSVVVFALALLGGNFVFVSAAPDLLRTLALGTPNGWMLRALTDLATTGGGFAHDLALAALPLAAMLGFSVVVGSIAAAMSRRVVSR